MHKRTIVILSMIFAVQIVGCGVGNTNGQSSDEEKTQQYKPSETKVWYADEKLKEEVVQETTTNFNDVPQFNEEHSDVKIYETDIDKDGETEYAATYLEDGLSNMIVYDNRDKKWLRVFESKDKGILTEYQKNQLKNIFEQWYGQGFAQEKNLEINELLDFNIVNLICYPVIVDKEYMIHVSYQIEEQTCQNMMKDDTIDCLFKYDNNDFSLYKCWYNGKYKSTKKFGA